VRSSQFFASIIILLILTACSENKFESLIKASRGKGYESLVKVGEGLPYLEKPRLNPVWDIENKNLARVGKLDLIDHNGKPAVESLFRGGPVFVAFFYSQCASFCPVVIRNMAEMEKKLTTSSKTKARFIAISVDPTRDKPAVLRKYLKKLFKGQEKSNWTMLTGQLKSIEAIAHNVFFIDTFQQLEISRIVHSERVFLVDDQGYIRTAFNGAGNMAPSADKALQSLN
jgi:protein SCO1/2